MEVKTTLPRKRVKEQFEGSKRGTKLLIPDSKSSCLVSLRNQRERSNAGGVFAAGNSIGKSLALSIKTLLTFKPLKKALKQMRRSKSPTPGAHTQSVTKLKQPKGQSKVKNQKHEGIEPHLFIVRRRPR